MVTVIVQAFIIACPLLIGVLIIVDEYNNGGWRK